MLANVPAKDRHAAASVAGSTNKNFHSYPIMSPRPSEGSPSDVTANDDVATENRFCVRFMVDGIRNN